MDQMFPNRTIKEVNCERVSVKIPELHHLSTTQENDIGQKM